MTDIFDNTILCKHCNTKMQRAKVAKNGFLLRAVVCGRCGDRVIHPADEVEYNRFRTLRNKEFHVKMRMVGNSYAVSIPKEIVSFIRAQEKIMDDMVRLCFEDFGKVSLNFNEANVAEEKVQENSGKEREKNRENRPGASARGTHVASVVDLKEKITK